MSVKRRYSSEPPDPRGFSERYDRMYSRIARAYDLAVPLLPFWRRWLSAALPHLAGPRVLEVSFGTGWLLTRYADRFEAHGIDLNPQMVRVATRNLQRRGLAAQLQPANVEAIPYPDETFDTVLSTMAFSGYPDANAAMRRPDPRCRWRPTLATAAGVRFASGSAALAQKTRAQEAGIRRSRSRTRARASSTAFCSAIVSRPANSPKRWTSTARSCRANTRQR